MCAGGGGAYHSILRRLEAFTDERLRAAVKDHEKRATMVLDLEEKVAAAERSERATKFNVEKIRPQDLADAAGPSDEET